jgi:tight adherence protein C
MLTVAPALAAASVLLAFLALDMRGRQQCRRLLDGAGAKWTGSGGLTRRFLEGLGRARPDKRGQAIGRLEGEFARRWERAGRPWSLHSIAGLEVVLGAGLAIAAAALGLAIGPALALAPVAALLGLRSPGIALARLARRRQGQMSTQVVDLVELLLATTEAGLAPPEALRRAATGLPDPLGTEVRLVVRQIDMGVPWRAALEDMAEMAELASLRRLVGALGRSQRLGASMREALRGVLQDLRADRRARAEEAARRAPVKMLFPLILLILPAFLLLTVGPVLLATIRSLQSG